jgi:hypothetical protein
MICSRALCQSNAARHSEYYTPFPVLLFLFSPIYLNMTTQQKRLPPPPRWLTIVIIAVISIGLCLFSLSYLWEESALKKERERERKRHAVQDESTSTGGDELHETGNAKQKPANARPSQDRSTARDELPGTANSRPSPDLAPAVSCTSHSAPPGPVAHLSTECQRQDTAPRSNSIPTSSGGEGP